MAIKTGFKGVVVGKRTISSPDFPICPPLWTVSIFPGLLESSIPSFLPFPPPSPGLIGTHSVRAQGVPCQSLPPAPWDSGNERGQFVMLRVGGDRHGCKNFCHVELDFLLSCLHFNSTQEICFVLWTLAIVTHTET